MNIFKYLETPFIWEYFRSGLELAIGVNAKRIAQMRARGVLDGNPSVLDVGCGSGHFSCITKGNYVGLDLNVRFIQYAQKKRGGPNKIFRCADVAALVGEQQSSDVVLLVDILHHHSDEQCEQLLANAARISNKYIANFEPLRDQPHPIGRWRVERDLGSYMRTLDSLHELFRRARLNVIESSSNRVGFENLSATLLKALK